MKNGFVTESSEDDQGRFSASLLDMKIAQTRERFPLLGLRIAVQLKQTGGVSRQTLSIPTARHEKRRHPDARPPLQVREVAPGSRSRPASP